jgi:hypothetical protein
VGLQETATRAFAPGGANSTKRGLESLKKTFVFIFMNFRIDFYTGVYIFDLYDRKGIWGKNMKKVKRKEEEKKKKRRRKKKKCQVGKNFYSAKTVSLQFLLYCADISL